MGKYKHEVLAVKALGENIGYGHLMSLTTALWRRQLGEKMKSGAFIGVCDCSIKKAHLKSLQGELELYDRLVASELEE